MSAVEPGESFTVACDEKHFQAYSLTLRDQRKLASIYRQIIEGEERTDVEQLGVYELACQALELAVVDPDAVEQELDFRQTLVLLVRVLQKQKLSEDEAKKSMSPPSSGAATCAEPATENAETLSMAN